MDMATPLLTPTAPLTRCPAHHRPTSICTSEAGDLADVLAALAASGATVTPTPVDRLRECDMHAADVVAVLTHTRPNSPLHSGFVYTDYVCIECLADLGSYELARGHRVTVLVPAHSVVAL